VPCPPARRTPRNPTLETLPKPTPVRMPSADSPLPGVVSGAVLVDASLPVVSGFVSAQAEVVLWLIPNRRPPIGLAVPDALGATPSGAFDTLGDEHLNKHMVPGARVALGYWWTTDNPWVPGGKLRRSGLKRASFSWANAPSASPMTSRGPWCVRSST